MPKHHTCLFLIAQHIIYQAFTHCSLKAHKHCRAFIIDALGILRLGPRDDKGRSSGRQGSVLGTTKAIPRDDKSDSSGEIGKVHAQEEDTADEERQLMSVFFYRSKGNILQKKTR